MESVSEVMNYNSISCKPQTRSSEIIYLMKKYDFTDLVVTNEAKRPVGIINAISVSDPVLEKIRHPFNVTAQECMYSITALVQEDTPIDECLTIMEKNHMDIMPVTNRLGEYCGIVKREDILSIH